MVGWISDPIKNCCFPPHHHSRLHTLLGQSSLKISQFWVKFTPDSWIMAKRWGWCQNVGTKESFYEKIQNWHSVRTKLYVASPHTVILLHKNSWFCRVRGEALLRCNDPFLWNKSHLYRHLISHLFLSFHWVPLQSDPKWTKKGTRR